MPDEPKVKRTIAFVDGQNLYRSVLSTFGCTHPDYDVEKLAQAVCTPRSWQLERVYFYTGVPAAADSPRWNSFWNNKLSALNRNPNVVVYRRPLIYHPKTIEIPGFGPYTLQVGQEKGIDVRLALDVLDTAHRNQFDVALIFSQGQDLNELIDIIKQVVVTENRWIKVASAYPSGPRARNRRGINNTEWCPIDKSTYDLCVDPHDYR